MAGPELSWFTLDHVFAGSGGWYIGSPDGFCIGPYDCRDAALAEVQDLKRQLPSAGGVGDLLTLIRRLLERRQENGAREASFGRMDPARSGELPRLGYRSPRFFATCGKWYFTTREGIDVGPYGSRTTAEQDQQRLVVLLQRCDTDQQRRATIVAFMTMPGNPGH